MSDFQDYAVAVEVLKPGMVVAETRRLMGMFLLDVVKGTMGSWNFLFFSLEETASDRLGALLDETIQARRLSIMWRI